MSKSLGLEKRKFLFVCNKSVSKNSIAHIIETLIKFIGMTPARKPRIDEYPYKDGGGVGYTGFFPLMESYIMVDAYTELEQTEILLSTCKPNRTNPFAIVTLLSKLIGPTNFVGTI